MKASALVAVLWLGSSVLVGCYSDYPPKLRSPGDPGTYGHVPTPGEIEICNKYARDQSIDTPLEASKDSAVGNNPRVDTMKDGTSVMPTPVVPAPPDTLDYDDAYQACMAKRGYDSTR